jgi:hypothetical protein
MVPLHVGGRAVPGGGVGHLGARKQSGFLCRSDY